MIYRFITEKLIDTLQSRPVVFLNGPRQVGKSTLVQWLAKNKHQAEYYTLDDMNVLSAIQSDPVGFISGLNGPVILDEIQRAPNLFLSIKAAVDSDRSPGRFLLTGSSHLMTLPKLSDALVGRMSILPLLPLSAGEIKKNKLNLVDHLFSNEPINEMNSSVSLDKIEKAVFLGGFPEVVGIKNQARRSDWFNDYLNTIIQRDVRDISNIVGLAELPKLLRLLANQSGQLFNLANLSRKTGIEQKTIKRYVSLLESVFIICSLPAWSTNMGKRLIKTPKVYFNDTGLLAHLLDVSFGKYPPHIIGYILENYVLLELMKMSSWSAHKINFYYYRTSNGVEVDIVMEDAQGKIVAIEVKRSSTINIQDSRGIMDLQTFHADAFHRGVIFYSGEKVIPFDKNIHAIPTGNFLGGKSN
ncbi:MAG: ATP-binding protein [Candidatus Marinimicrobia bacterium]|nr:ATP-binding protein [Candidatus Neomarinimicrobiota bacterium]